MRPGDVYLGAGAWYIALPYCFYVLYNGLSAKAPKDLGSAVSTELKVVYWRERHCYDGKLESSPWAKSARSVPDAVRNSTTFVHESMTHGQLYLDI